MKYTHDTDISSDIVLNLEDELDVQKDITNASKNYKWLCRHVLQDVLNNFLGWFGQESIERYIIKKKEPIDEDKLDKLAQEQCHKILNTNVLDSDIYYEIYKSGYRKALEEK